MVFSNVVSVVVGELAKEVEVAIEVDLIVGVKGVVEEATLLDEELSGPIVEDSRKDSEGEGTADEEEVGKLACRLC